MLGAILAFFNPLSSIAGKIAETLVAIKAEENTERKIKLEKTMAGLEAQRAVLVATQQFMINRLMRFLIAAPVAIVLWKLFVWDKVLGLGITDSLSDDLWDVLKIVVSGYFLTNIVQGFRK